MRSSIITLQSQLEQAKERLKDVEENIKKSTGRDFTQVNTNRQVFKRTARHFDDPEGGQGGGGQGGGATPGGGAPGTFKKRISDVKGRLGDWVKDDRPNAPVIQRPGFGANQRSVIPMKGRIVTRPFTQPPTTTRDRDNKVEESPRISARKRLDIPSSGQPALTVFSRLSGPPKEEETEKVKVTSQVLVQEMPSRKEILAAQSKDKSCKERNRRMFGALLGTLQKFRQEESKLKEKEEKKAQVERKVEEAAEREKEEAKKARRELFSLRRQGQINIRHLEFKLAKLRQLSEWEANKNKLLPFIQTEAQPKIFYLPKKHNDKTKVLLQSHQTRVQKAIEKKRSEIEKLIEAHVPQPDDNDKEDAETPMDTGETHDDSIPLMPESDHRDDEDDDDDEEEEEEEEDTNKQSDDENTMMRHHSSSPSLSESELSSSPPRQKQTKDNERISDKENHLSLLSDVKIKIEAT